MATAQNNYVCTLTPEQSQALRAILEERGWTFDAAPYTFWRAKKGKTNVISYASGKLVVQGNETSDFVLFILEPEILKAATFGYENQLAEIDNPEMFQPHAGIDESGKGDFFGPLVIAACFTDERSARNLLQAGIADSKTIGSDAKIHQLAKIIRKECFNKYAVVAIGPEAYNRLYASFNNLNRLLAWGHAKSLEKLLEQVPDCPRAISDQFARSTSTVKQALQERGRKIEFIQKTKAEADIAVAAASILARDEFIRRLKLLGEQVNTELPRGAGPKVLETGRKLAQSIPKEQFASFAKLHFKTLEDIFQPNDPT